MQRAHNLQFKSVSAQLLEYVTVDTPNDSTESLYPGTKAVFLAGVALQGLGVLKKNLPLPELLGASPSRPSGIQTAAQSRQLKMVCVCIGGRSPGG